MGLILTRRRFVQAATALVSGLLYDPEFKLWRPSKTIVDLGEAPPLVVLADDTGWSYCTRPDQPGIWQVRGAKDGGVEFRFPGFSTSHSFDHAA